MIIRNIAVPGSSATHYEVKLCLDPAKMLGTTPRTLARNGIGDDIAQPFLLTIYAHDPPGDLTEVGLVQAVHHKSLREFELEPPYNACRQLVYVDLLYVDPQHSGCGLATRVLESLPEIVSAELGGCADAIILAPVPQYRDESGDIKQLPMGREYLAQYLSLIKFYKKRGFTPFMGPLLLGKLLLKEEVS